MNPSQTKHHIPTYLHFSKSVLIAEVTVYPQPLFLYYFFVFQIVEYMPHRIVYAG